MEPTIRGNFVLSQSTKHCYSLCQFFQCGQRALDLKGKRAFCRWVGDKCAGDTCNYVICTRSRLLPNGICGMTIKRKTKEEEFEPELLEEHELNVKGKLRKRFKNTDFF